MTIEVFFVDARTGEAFAQSSMPPGNLPETFAHDTTFNLAGQDWRVIKAEPMTAKEFIRTGKLVITLEQVMLMPAKNILYTLPTICDEVPSIAKDTSKQGRNVFELHEDDWRQIEFVSHSYREVIGLQFSEINRIFNEQSIDNGEFLSFRELYIRKEISKPIQYHLTLKELSAALPESVFRYDGVAYIQVDGLIGGGFAFDVESLIVYGQHIDGLVNILGVQFDNRKMSRYDAVIASFMKIMSTYNLYLIDWCKVTGVNADVARLRKYFE